MFVSAADWRGVEYRSYEYPPENSVIDGVRQKIIERYNLSESYFADHFIIASGDVYCQNPTDWEWQYSTRCRPKKENPGLLQSAVVNWIYVPEQEEYQNQPFFKTAKVYVNINAYTSPGLEQALNELRNRGVDMSRLVIDESTNTIYSFSLLNDLLEVLKPGVRLIPKAEAERKLLACVGAFASEPHIGLKYGVIYMGASGPVDARGQYQAGKVDLKTGVLTACSRVGPAELALESKSKSNVLKLFLELLQKIAAKRN